MKNEVKKRSRKDDVEVEDISDSEKISLSDTQMRVIEAILARRSVFFTGAAGVLSHHFISFSAVNHASHFLVFRCKQCEVTYIRQIRCIVS